MEPAAISKLRYQKGDITKEACDAIVNAANSSLLGGGGVDGAIHRGAGPELLAECRTIGGCPTGEARLTKAYQLPAKFIIHTVGPIYSGAPDDSRMLTSCYTTCLNLAIENNIKTIAFPAISCGVYGYPLQEACQIAIDTCLAFLSQDKRIETISFILFNDELYQIYHNYFETFK